MRYAHGVNVKMKREPFVHERSASPFLSEGALLLAAVLWGVSYVFLKNALDVLPAHFILAVRFTGATLILLPVFYRRIRKHVNKACLLRGGLMGLFLFAACSVQVLGLKTVDPGKNAFLTAVYVVLVPFIYWIVKGRRPDGYHVFGALFCMVGVGMIAMQSGLTISLGDGLSLLGGLFFALHLVCVAIFSQDRDPVVITLIQFAVTAALSWLVWGIFEPAPTSIGTQVIYEIGYLTVFATAAALLLQSIGQQHTHPAPAAVLLSLEAVLGAIFSVVVYGERVSWVKGFGFGLIFFAIILSQTQLRFFKRRLATPVPEIEESP